MAKIISNNSQWLQFSSQQIIRRDQIESMSLDTECANGKATRNILAIRTTRSTYNMPLQEARQFLKKYFPKDTIEHIELK